MEPDILNAEMKQGQYSFKELSIYNENQEKL